MHIPEFLEKVTNQMLKFIKGKGLKIVVAHRAIPDLYAAKLTLMPDGQHPRHIADFVVPV